MGKTVKVSTRVAVKNVTVSVCDSCQYIGDRERHGGMGWCELYGQMLTEVDDVRGDKWLLRDSQCLESEYCEN